MAQQKQQDFCAANLTQNVEKAALNGAKQCTNLTSG